MEDDLSTALEHHRQGRLERAARIYEQIIAQCSQNADALHLLGLVALQQGEPARAEVLIGRAIAVDSGVSVYHANRAEAYRMLGQYENAAGSGRVALRLRPHFPAVVSNLGLALHALGQIEAAVEQFREALRLQPDFALAHNNLGIALHAQGHKAEAHDHFLRAVHFGPNVAEIQANLGQSLLERGRPEEALSHCREAVRLRGDFAQARMIIGRVLRELGQPVEARVHSAEAIRLDPRAPGACDDMGQLLHEEGNITESLAWFERCLQLDPEHAPAHTHRGVLLVEMGDNEGAEQSFRAALRLGSGNAEAFYQLATLKGAALPEADLAALQLRLAAAELSGDERSTLLAGLGHVLDARGDYNGAAEHMAEAHALRLADWKSRGLECNAQNHERFVERLIATCTPAYFARVRDFGLKTERPVFIVGLPRSGTTLTEQILARHSQVFGAGELVLVRESFNRLPRLMNLDASTVDCLGRLDRENARVLAGHHLDQLAALDQRALRIVDKMPENYLFLGFLAALFPHARFIHCRRDLRDVAVSCWMTHLREIRWANDPRDIASRFHSYHRIMDHWTRVLPVRWLDVWYEETVFELESVARRLVAWCGLDWEAECLTFHEGRNTVRSASAAQVRRPIYNHSIGRWKNYERPLAPLLAAIESVRLQQDHDRNDLAG